MNPIPLQIANVEKGGELYGLRQKSQSPKGGIFEGQSGDEEGVLLSLVGETPGNH